MDIRVAGDAAAAAAVAADWLAWQIRNAARRRGAALVALSGGSTPVSMLAELVMQIQAFNCYITCLLYTSPSPRD